MAAGQFLTLCLGIVVASAGLLPVLAPLVFGADASILTLDFIYGSEKKPWVDEVTKQFNALKVQTASGKTIQIKPKAMGSGESVYEILNGVRKAHLASPASSAYIELVNADAKEQGKEVLIDPRETKTLVLSPVVIAMWQPMAKAMGWPNIPIGWKDVHDLAKDPKGWDRYKRPQWGPFRFGHTHPEFSNSGLISILATVYAAAGSDKRDDLTLDEVRRKKVAAYMETVERSVVHYGSSTGFFGRRMYANDMTYLNAAILYENMVVESYLPEFKKGRTEDLVAIYPKEGTFWSDHPIGIVNRPWVSADHKEAGKKYIDYLREPAQQRLAMKYGFRPALEKIKLAAPLDAEHGVNPEARFPIMEVPSAEIMKEILGLWRKHRKQSRIVLVVDTSGSMREGGKLKNAQKGAHALLELLDDRDTLSLLSFSDKHAWVAKDQRLTPTVKKDLAFHIDTLLANGATALYDSIDEAFKHLGAPDPHKISAIVVLTDGEDTSSKLKLNQLLDTVRFDAEKQPTRIFTICYGKSAVLNAEEKALAKILSQISEATKARGYIGEPRTVRDVFKDIATFF